MKGLLIISFLLRIRDPHLAITLMLLPSHRSKTQSISVVLNGPQYITTIWAFLGITPRPSCKGHVNESQPGGFNHVMTILSDGDRICSKIFPSQPGSNKKSIHCRFRISRLLHRYLRYPSHIRQKKDSADEMTDVNVNGNWAEGFLFISDKYWHQESTEILTSSVFTRQSFTLLSTTNIPSTPTDEKRTLSPSDTKRGQRTTEKRAANNGTIEFSFPLWGPWLPRMLKW